VGVPMRPSDFAGSIYRRQAADLIIQNTAVTRNRNEARCRRWAVRHYDPSGIFLL